MKNKGFSLVELLVVIAILAILGIAAGFGISNVTRYRLTKTDRLLYQVLEETKTNAMSKDLAYVTIGVKEDGSYYVRTETGEERILGSKSLGITYNCADHKVEKRQITKEETLTLSFDKASGAFLPVIQTVEEHGFSYRITADGSYLYCDKIEITQGDRAKGLILYQATGKCERYER